MMSPGLYACPDTAFSALGMTRMIFFLIPSSTAFMNAVELGIKKNINLVIPSAENAVSGHAYKPGDIITSYAGISVEVGNTDAEGRLVLADGVAYAQKKYKI